MKVFSSTVALLMAASTASGECFMFCDFILGYAFLHFALVNIDSILTQRMIPFPTARDALGILARPHIAKAMSATHEPGLKLSTGDDGFELCHPEIVAAVTCLGPPCITCIVDVLMDIEEDDTCETLEAGTFCGDIMACITGHCSANDCTDELLAIEDCFDENYDVEEEEEECPDLCYPKETDTSASSASEDEQPEKKISLHAHESK